MYAYPRWLLESVYLRDSVCSCGTVLVYRAPAHPAAAKHTFGAAAVGLLGVFVRDYDVQLAAARRHHRPRRGHGHCYDRARAVGLDAGGLGCAADPGAVLWGWRCDRLWRELF